MYVREHVKTVDRKINMCSYRRAYIGFELDDPLIMTTNFFRNEEKNSVKGINWMGLENFKITRKYTRGTPHNYKNISRTYKV